jgi:predicted membrane GTPase involved in stress response
MSFQSFILREVKSALPPLANLTEAAGMQAYMKGIAPYFGIKTPMRRQVLKEIFKRAPIPTSDELGQTAQALWKLQERGRMFVHPVAEVYNGMIVGEHAKENDLEVNICREKKLTNVRTSSADEAIRLVPVKPLTLEQAMEWIRDDELIEVTPSHVRLRCRDLDPHKRNRGRAEKINDD